MNIRYPDITAPTPEGQVQQLTDFLRQFITEYNIQIASLTYEIEQLKGGQNG